MVTLICDLISDTMAAQSAHLTSTTAEEGDKPSIFEVLAQESLVYSLRPALQHLLRVFAESNPSRYGHLYVYSDEVYLLLELILENYYLKHYSASFSENFYGLKRVMSPPKDQLFSKMSNEDPNDSQFNGKLDAEDTDKNRIPQSDRVHTDQSNTTLYKSLPRSCRVRSLALLVIFPYLKGKCDRWYEKLKDEYRLSTYHAQTVKQRLLLRLCRVFLTVYPVLHCLWELVQLLYTMGFTFGRTSVHSPLLRWAGVVLQNLTEDDLQGYKGAETPSLKGKSLMQVAAILSSRVLSGVAVTLSTGLSVGVFFLQFLEWWYASDQHAATLTALPNPPAPKTLQNSMVPKLHTLCPLCQKVRTNDTALAVSGYVFCYSCITTYIHEHSQCPLTKYPATTDHLIRIYTPDS